MKKALFILILIFTLSGCSVNESTTPTVEEKPSPDSPNIITKTEITVKTGDVFYEHEETNKDSDIAKETWYFGGYTSDTSEKMDIYTIAINHEVTYIVFNGHLYTHVKVNYPLYYTVSTNTEFQLGNQTFSILGTNEKKHEITFISK